VLLLVLLLFLLPCWVRSLYPGAGQVWLHIGAFSARIGSLGWRLIGLVIRVTLRDQEYPKTVKSCSQTR